MKRYVLDASVAARWFLPASQEPFAEEALELLREYVHDDLTLLIKDAFDIATAFGQTVYDSIYVALAAASGAPLVTADERLLKALGASFPMQWLRSCESPRLRRNRGHQIFLNNIVE